MNLAQVVSTKSNYTIPIVLFVSALLIYSYNLEGQPRHGDEINYLGWAGNYIHLVNEGDYSNPCLTSIDQCNLLYHIPAHGATYSPLRMILIGFPMNLKNQDTGDFYDWSCYWFTCYDFQKAPTVEQMAAGRLLSPVFGALTIVVSFLVGKTLFNRYVGIIFSLLFLFYNLWIWYSRTIMTEVHYIFFSMLALMFLVYSFKSGRMKIKYFILGAISYGCALTSKLLSVEFAAVFVGIIFFNGILQKQSGFSIGKKQIIIVSLCIVAFFSISILAFLMTEPGFFKNPIDQITLMKTDMDNYNRDVWFIAYPTINGLQPTRMLSLFHYTLFPSPIEYKIPGAFPNSTFNIGWNSPQTNSTIAMSLFFFIGFGYIIQKVRRLKDCIPETLAIIWFVSTFIMTLMIARDLSLERYMLPFLLSIILIASYGFWRFTKDISNKKAKFAFVIYLVFAHAVTSLSYWQKIYLSPGTFWTNPLPYGTLQESLSNPFLLFVNSTFLGFFLYLVLNRLRNKIKTTA